MFNGTCPPGTAPGTGRGTFPVPGCYRPGGLFPLGQTSAETEPRCEPEYKCVSKTTLFVGTGILAVLGAVLVWHFVKVDP